MLNRLGPVMQMLLVPRAQGSTACPPMSTNAARPRARDAALRGVGGLREAAEAREFLHRGAIRAQRVDRGGLVGIAQCHSAIDEFVLLELKVSLQAQPQSRPGLLHA